MFPIIDIQYLKHALPQGIEEEFFEYLSQLTAKDITLYAIREGSVAFPRYWEVNISRGHFN